MLNISKSEASIKLSCFLTSRSSYLKNIFDLISSATVDGRVGFLFLIFHKRRRKHSRKKNGHRQRHSKIQITKIMTKDGKVIDEAKINVTKKTVKKESVEKKKVTKK